MPRRESLLDTGDDGIGGAPDRYSFTAMHYNQAFLPSPSAHDDAELEELERRLNDEVDEDFFEEPRKFNTLQRVIDVLGLQMIDDATFQSTTELGKNPAYRQLKAQQQIVEGAIEHMAVLHCADLNGSVIQVGRVARQFSDAVSKVRTLRKQVRDIQDTLGAAAAASANPNEAGAASGGMVGVPSRPAAAAMSLRELWLKKLECEATLSLLEKLDVIRAAPARFDMLIRPPCRIGAAVLTLAEALQTMFSDDIAQVQALHKIMEQLLLRKQRAEEIIWDTLHDVIYLRTGNGFVKRSKEEDGGAASGSGSGGGVGTKSTQSTTTQSVSSDSRRSAAPHRVSFRPTTRNVAAGNVTTSLLGGMINPFIGSNRRFAMDEDLDDNSVSSTGSASSLFSIEEGDDEAAAEPTVLRSSKTSTGSSSSTLVGIATAPKRLMIPIPVVEAEMDLEADERRCMEELALSSMANNNNSNSNKSNVGSTLRQRQLPRYDDPVLALRILAECLASLKRLDDVERVIGEGLEREIRRIVQREQARTFARLEKKRATHHQNIRSMGGNKMYDLKDFRLHLTGLLSAFGCVLVRLSHMTEILRLRIAVDKELQQKIESPSTVMRSVLVAAQEMMQREIKAFLKACLNESDGSRSDPMDTSSGKRSSAYERGLFTLGIVDSGTKPGQQSQSTATRTNVMELSTAKFVANILCSKTKVTPQIRHALVFRRSVANWASEIEDLKKELAMMTNEDTSSPSYQLSPADSAIAYLDTVIQKELLPVLQEEAVNGTVKGLERKDAFDPVLDRSIFSRPDSNEPQDVDMCKACQAMYDSTSPLFQALHRLPRGGEMYMPLVAVLEHVMLTFISRVKQQMSRICDKKTANTVLTEADEQGNTTLSQVSERRRAFVMLRQAYADGDSLESTVATDALSNPAGLMPLTPSTADTATRLGSKDGKVGSPLEPFGDGVDAEELVFQQELKCVKKYLSFDPEDKALGIVVCTDEELMKAACLAHSLLKVSSMVESRLKVRGVGFSKTLTGTRTLHEAIKTIKQSGMKMAKFCRVDMMMQAATRLAKVPLSSTLVARDAVRIPSSVNDLGEYMTSASENLQEAAGNAVTAYTFSSLEQFIPHCLKQAVRVIASGKGIVTRSPLSINGVEALDRSGSVLYRDLKGATGFDHSFWDVELAAVSFERSASFIAMMELKMEELAAYYSANREDFAQEDFMLMFAMNGPRRTGDISQYHMLNRHKK